MSYDRVKQMVQKLSGITGLEDYMCIKPCAAFTGTYADLDSHPR